MCVCIHTHNKLIRNKHFIALNQVNKKRMTNPSLKHHHYIKYIHLYMLHIYMCVCVLIDMCVFVSQDLFGDNSHYKLAAY